MMSDPNNQPSQETQDQPRPEPTLHDEIARLADSGFPLLADMLRRAAKFLGHSA